MTVDETRTGATTERAAVRAFVEAAVDPRADEYDAAEKLPADLVDEVAARGLLAPFLPVSTGGRNLDMVSFGAVHEEIGRGCSSLRSLLTVHSMVAWSVQRWGTQEQHDRWLRALAEGTVIGSFALSEPGGGGAAGSVTHTSAEPNGTGWLLNGHKKWLTAGQLADVFLVFARTGDDGVSAFLVPRDTPGVTVVPMHGLLGTRASMVAELRLSGVRLGGAALLGPANWASATVMTGALDIGRYSVACGCVGILQACVEACARYTAQRRSGEHLLRDQQLIRRKISDMVTNTTAARLLCERAGALKDTDSPETIMATWIAKYFASTAAAAAASDAVHVHGANGCVPDFPVARLYRDVKIMEIIEGTSEMQQIAIATEAYKEVAL
jgi:alkylation response protein AidB-like acyl-CoA dehydrogenase